MKTAISVPDEVFEAAEQAADELGMSRSELYATAVREFVTRLQLEGVTSKLNAVYGEEGEAGGIDPVLEAAQRAVLCREPWN
ncbi:MAG: hypothetical protein HOI95_05345 [Chromatiales bacterium]|nr:hypothetical protein [Chromatiales bacterium]